MMTLSESLGQKCHPVSHAAPLKRNTPTPFSFLSLSPRQTGVVEKKNGWLSVQCIPPISFTLRISWTSVAPSSMNEAVFTISVESKSCVCFFKPRASTIPSLPWGLGVFFRLVCSTHLTDKRGALEQARTSLYHLG